MKVNSTDDFLKMLETSPTAGRLRFYWRDDGFQALECPSLSAQESHNPQAISDSVCETMMDLDLHNRRPVFDWDEYGTTDSEHPLADGEDWVITIPTIPTGETNITADFVERLAAIMSKLWKEQWKREEERAERARREWDLFPDLECDLGMV